MESVPIFLKDSIIAKDENWFQEGYLLLKKRSGR